MSMSRRRRRVRSRGKGRPNVWTWVWIVIAVLLVVGLALRRAPVEGSPLLPAAVAAEQDAGGEAEEIERWVEALRRPDGRQAFLDAAGKLGERWEAHPQVAPLVEELLTMPQYSASAVWRFVGQDLLRTEDEDRMRQLARTFGQFGGEGYPEGLRIELRAFIDRNPAAGTRDHRRALEVIGEEALEVDEEALVEVAAIEQHTLAQLIDLLPAELGGAYEQAMAEMLEDMASITHDVYHPIDRAIGETHDYVALACARYLWDRPEHEPSIRKYLERRLDRSELYGTAIRQMLNDLNER